VIQLAAVFEAQGYVVILVAGGGKRFARGANAHLSDDETVAKMGHPRFVVD
jgi:hypothetical protein